MELRHLVAEGGDVDLLGLERVDQRPRHPFNLVEQGGRQVSRKIVEVAQSFDARHEDHPRDTTLGQANHFLRFNPGKSDYAEKRHADEAARLYGVLDRRLADHEYLADAYSIADIATWPWISRWPWHRIDWTDYPDLKRWFTAIAARAAVQKGWRVPFDAGEIPIP